MTERTDEEKEIKIPDEVSEIITKLHQAGFEAYAVGGCVRDILLAAQEGEPRQGRGKKPKDWDVTTNAMPEKIRELFPESFYENKFFTVTVKTGSEDETLREIEVTTFRAEGRYEDKRHPEDVKPAKTLGEDLARRDFTVNAMALCLSNDDRITSNSSRIRSFEKHSRKDIRDALERYKLIDPFSGQADLKNKLIRAVGNPEERFSEDALRMLRAVRLATELGFSAKGGPASGWEIEKETKEAIIKNSGWIQAISKERVRDEFSKLLMSDNAWPGLELLHQVGLLKHIVPELETGIGCGQNKHHIFPVWEHNMRTLDYAAKQNWPLNVRMGALLHDVGKPRTKQGEGPDSTFYGHDVVGAKMTAQILSRLRYPDDFIQKIVKLVRWHLFRYDYEADEVQTTDSSIRRLIRNVGVENIEDLVKVRMCDRVGSGVPKAVPYRLRHFQFRVEKILREGEAVKVTMLKVGGENVMKILGIQPGPKVGHILNALLEEVLDDPKKNGCEYLEKRITELGGLSDKELVELREKAESRVELLEDQREEEIKKKYWVK